MLKRGVRLIQIKNAKICEPSHLDQHCLPPKKFRSVVLKELTLFILMDFPMHVDRISMEKAYSR